MCFGSQYEDNFKKKMAGAGVSRWAGRGKKSKFLAGVTRKNRERSGGGGGDWPGAGGHEPWGSYMPWARARTPKIPPDTDYRASEASGIRHDAH